MERVEEVARAMRVLFSSNPMYGHVNTMLPLAGAAQTAGHDVAWATGASMAPLVESRGIRTWQLGPAAAPAGASVDWIQYFLVAASERVGPLTSRAAQWQPDVVVHEDTDLAGAVAALHSGARHLIHGLGLMPPVRIWDVFEQSIDRLINETGGVTPAHEVREATYLDVCPPSLQTSPGERIWNRVLPLRHSAGSPAPGDQLDLAIVDALPNERLVHLTLGTVFSDAVEVLRTAIDGLRHLPVNLVVTVGPGGDPSALGQQPPHVVIERYLPHSVLLPRCDAVVSQGGAGIMFGALAHGLPQLVLPQGGDQHMNADALARSGAGLALLQGEVTAEAVSRAMTQLLGEPDFSRAAADVQSEILATPDADSVMSGIAAMVDRR